MSDNNWSSSFLGAIHLENNETNKYHKPPTPIKPTCKKIAAGSGLLIANAKTIANNPENDIKEALNQ